MLKLVQTEHLKNGMSPMSLAFLSEEFHFDEIILFHE